MRDAGEFMEALKIDLFADEVFVFTPKGDVKSLPERIGARGLRLQHPHAIGHQCVGAKVNGRMVPLDYQLKNGDIVEILTQKTNPGPSADWLNSVQTAKAKNRIRQWIREQRRDEDIEAGRDLLEKELRKRGQEVHEHLKPEALQAAAKRFGFTEGEDLLAAVGDNKVSAGMVASHLAGEREQEAPPQLSRGTAEAAPPWARGQGARPGQPACPILPVLQPGAG